MARFDDLPEETVLGIWPHVHPNAVESFALTCRRIHNLGAKAITEHNTLRRIYRTLVNEPSQDTEEELIRAPRSELLINPILDIMREPRIAYYVEELRMQYCSSEWFEIFDDTERKRQTFRHLDILSRLLERCEYLRRKEIILWWHQISIGNEDPILGILLNLLPNVRILRFDPYDTEPTLCLGLIRRMAQDQRSLALSRLNEVTIEASELHGMDHLSTLATFASLPSMTKMIANYIKHCCDGDCKNGTNRVRAEFRPKSSNVKTLQLHNANLPLSIFDRLLKMFKALNSFTYTPDEQGFRFDSYVVRRAVASHAKDSLKTLTLLAGNRRKRYMGTIHDFKYLTTLTTDWQLLLPPGQIDSCTLAAALPPSIQEVTLLVDDKFNAERGKRLIRHLLGCTRYHHRSLGVFSIKHLMVPAMEILLNDKTVEIAQATGLTLQLDNTPNVIRASDISSEEDDTDGEGMEPESQEE